MDRTNRDDGPVDAGDPTGGEPATAVGPADAELVVAALAGDRSAVGDIYDRYADRLHSMCTHLLGDRDEASDVTAEVFLVAMDRLGQLKDPKKLKPWLYAIARHEIYRRTKRAARTRPIEEVDEMDRLTTQQMAAGAPAEPDDEVDQAQLVHVLREASLGLDDRDRMVMELQLQGLGGDELAAALGTSTSTAYQHVHRMKERLGRSVGAVLVARQGRADCDELDRLLAGWDGAFSVLWRKRVARHVDRCELCERRRAAAPAALLGVGGVVAPFVGASPVSAAPASVRDRVLSEAAVGSGASPGRWRSDGFPPASRRVQRRGVIGAAAAVVLLAIVAAAVLWPTDELEGELSAQDASPPPAGVVDELDDDLASGPTGPAGSDPRPAEAEVAPPIPGDGTGVEPVDAEVPAVPADPAPVIPPAPTEPRPPPTSAPRPVVDLVGPSTVFHPTPGSRDCGASTEFVASSSTATRVQLRWSVAAGSGLVEMQDTGGQWRAVLELPEGTPGPVEVVAVGLDGRGTSGTSPTLTAAVAPCPTPG